jgi:hypothetical protein
MLLTAPISIGIAVLGSMFSRGSRRAWWLGFALLSCGYLSLAFTPWLDEKLGLTHFLDYVHMKMVGSRLGSPSENLYRWLVSSSATSERFRQVGHALFALLAGLVGGTVAAWYWRRERPTARRKPGAGS